MLKNECRRRFSYLLSAHKAFFYTFCFTASHFFICARTLFVVHYIFYYFYLQVGWRDELPPPTEFCTLQNKGACCGAMRACVRWSFSLYSFFASCVMIILFLLESIVDATRALVQSSWQTSAPPASTSRSKRATLGNAANYARTPSCANCFSMHTSYKRRKLFYQPDIYKLIF